ncbi:MAG: hypothetical protein ACJ8EO_13465 [Sphingomicrobium sp.]
MHSGSRLGGENLHRARNQAAARWLDELAGAIAQAQHLAWTLGVAEGDSAEARTLYARLEALRSEIDSLRFGDWAEIRQELDPKWLDSVVGACPLPAVSQP